MNLILATISTLSWHVPMLAHADFADMIFRAVVYSAVGHMLRPLFEGHGMLGTIVIGVVILGVAYVLKKKFF